MFPELFPPAVPDGPHPLEVRHHFGCCRQTVTLPIERAAYLAELVKAHDCPHADADELPSFANPRGKRPPSGKRTAARARKIALACGTAK